MQKKSINTASTCTTVSIHAFKNLYKKPENWDNRHILPITATVYYRPISSLHFQRTGASPEHTPNIKRILKMAPNLLAFPEI